MKTKLDISSWKRRDHFNFFKSFDEPFYHINVNVECTDGLKKFKAAGHSVFAWYFFNAMLASNIVEEFRYRIEDDEVFIYDVIHASPTVSRENGTFGFGQVNYEDNFESFQKSLKDEIDRVRGLDGLFTSPERPDVIHYSALPWFSFTGLSHPRNYGDGDSIPKITFGKIFEQDGKSYLPLSVQVHHGLVDGYHVSKFVELFRRLLND